MLRRIMIKNLFQYQSFDVDFTDGVNIILGPNGAGKTNLLNSIFFALTGILPAKKALCSNVHSSGKSSVALEWIHDNDVYTVHRDFDGQVILYRGATTLHQGATAVNQAIEDLFGISRMQFELCLYIRQGTLRQFVDATVKERNEWISQLLGLDKIHKIWQKLGQYIAVREAKYENDYVSEYNQYLTLKQELNNYNTNYTRDEIYSQAEQLAKAEDALKTINNLAQRLARIRDSIQLLQNDVDQLSEPFEENPIYESYSRDIQDQVVRFKRDVAAFKEHFEERANLATYKKLVRLQQELEQRLAVTRNLLRQYKNYILDLQETDHCPICGSAVDTQNLLLSFKERLQSCADEKENLEKKLNQVETALQGYKAKIQARHSLRLMLTRLREQRKALHPYLNIDEADYRGYMKRKQQWLEKKNKIDDARKTLERYRDQEATLSDMIQEKRRHIMSIPRRLRDEEKLRDYIHIVRTCIDLYSKLDVLEPLAKKHLKIRENRKALETVIKVRDAFHSSKLGKLLITNFMAVLIQRLNDFLKAFNSDYTVVITPQHDLEIWYKNSAKISEKSLSYGEQGMFALCMCFAINSLISGPKFILLDEPTLGLDDDHVALIPALFQLVAAQYGTGYQILCATHEKRLLACAKRIITIGNSE